MTEASILPNVVHEGLQVELCIDTHNEEGIKSLCVYKGAQIGSQFL
jgi:hypothetical protein